MDDDFNTPVATSVLFDLARVANQASGVDRYASQLKLLELGDVLGLPLEQSRTETTATASDAAPFIELLLELRQELRKEKQFALADSVRDRLDGLGVSVEDTPDGPVWRWTG
jgi:cysteinyl-tRNA synthetase